VRLVVVALAMTTAMAAAVGYGGPASGSPARQAAPGARWTEQMRYPASIGQLGAMTCLTATNCVAVGTSGNQAEDLVVAVIATTSDGGRTWTSRPLPNPVASLADVSCAPSGQCLAVGGSTGSGGTPTNPNQAGVALTSSDGGRTWTSADVPAGVGDLGNVACPTATFCLVVGRTPDNEGGVALTTTTVGKVWTKRQMPSADDVLSDVACPSSMICLGLGSRDSTAGEYPVVLRTTDGGASWLSTPLGGQPSGSLSCPSVITCFVAESISIPDGSPTAGIMATADGGASWASQTVPPIMGGLESSGGLSAISCGSATSCVAVGGGIGPRGGLGSAIVLTTTDGGAVWTSQAPPDGMGGFAGVACVDPSDCVADGTDPSGGVTLSAATSDGGTQWTSQAVPGGIGALTGIACGSPLRCLAVGTAASGTYILASGNGGVSWSPRPVPGGVAGLTDVSCGSATHCVAVGGYRTAPNAENSGLLQGVVAATSDGGARWTARDLPTGVGTLNSVSCASAASCVAVGEMPNSSPGVAVATTDGGTTWSERPLMVGEGGLTGVSCPTPAHCVAVGPGTTEEGTQGSNSPPSIAAVTTNGGVSWSRHPFPADGVTPAAVSCSSVDACVAVGSVSPDYSVGIRVLPGAGLSTANGGLTWTRRSIVRSGNLVSVSCPTRAVCVAVGRSASGTRQAILLGSGRASAWTALSVAVDVGPLTAVFCPTQSTCEVAGVTALGGGLVGRAQTGVSR
jgi:hypothetical protein